MKSKKNRLGFTLIELVVTTAIMGTLAAVAIPSYLETQTKAKSEKTMANIAAFGSEIAKQFNELASLYGSVQLASGATGVAVVGTSAADVPIVDGGNILRATRVSVPSTVSGSRTWLDIFPGGVYKSPFGDLEYLMTVDNPGSVSYTADESGNVTPIVTKAQLTISDPEALQFTATFAF